MISAILRWDHRLVDPSTKPNLVKHMVALLKLFPGPTSS